MKTVIQFPDRARTQEEAAAWVVRLDRGELAAGEKEALRAWLDADPGHRVALEHMAQVWGELDSMVVLAELSPAGDKPVARVRQRWIPASAIGAAAMVVVAAGLYLVGIFDSLRTMPEEAADQTALGELVYRTELGEQSNLQLRDGSRLTLNTQSEVHIRFDRESRTVYLTRGEVHFEVASSPQRPFVVYAGRGRVRAVGTAFNVKLIDEQVEVLVSEGIVEVMAEAEMAEADSHRGAEGGGVLPAQSVLLKQGGTARFAQGITRSETVSVEKIEQRLAWRKGKWMFEGETLAEVLAEVHRYTDREIIITDPDLAGLRVGGYFDIGDVDGLMEALETGFGIQTVRNGDVYRLEAGVPTEG